MLRLRPRPALHAQAAAPIMVSLKLDTEGGLLGQLIGQSLKAHGPAVTDKISLGTTPSVRKALTAGEFDIYPENTPATPRSSSIRPTIRSGAMPPRATPAARQFDYQVNHLVWLTLAPASNTWGVARLAGFANVNHLWTFSDFGKCVTAGGKVKLVASAEFVNSASALPAFEKTYGFKPERLPVLSGGDTAVTIKTAVSPDRRRERGDGATAPTARSNRPAWWCSPTTTTCSRSMRPCW